MSILSSRDCGRLSSEDTPLNDIIPQQLRYSYSGLGVELENSFIREFFQYR